RQLGPRGRHVEAAVGGEPGEEDVGEGQLGRGAAGGDVAHVQFTTRSRPVTLATAGSSRNPWTVVWIADSLASWVMKTRRASGPSPSCSAARMLTPLVAST